MAALQHVHGQRAGSPARFRLQSRAKRPAQPKCPDPAEGRKTAGRLQPEGVTLNTSHRHFILWTKGWYPTLGKEPVEAMRVIMARVSATELRYVSRADAISFIIDVALKYGRIDRQGLTYAIVQDRHLGFTRGMQDVLETLAAAARHVDKTDLPDLGKPDLLTTTTLN